MKNSWIAKSLACAALGMLVSSAAVRADVLRLMDGTSLEGTVKRNSDGYDVTLADGKVIQVPAESVKGIGISAKGGGSIVEAQSRLASLRRSVENVPDIKSILDRYAHFIEQNKGSPIAKEAEQDAATWRERSEKGMVKLGTRWMSPTDREKVQERGLMAADQARQLLKQGRMKDAEPILQQALDEDPGNISAAYLRGYVAFKQDQIPAARKYFEGVIALYKDHAPSLNNLAVISWRQNQQTVAMNLYDQAMLASPLNKEILNNVAEALNAMPANLRGSAPAQKALKHYTEQDTALQQQLAAKGWYRWGSTWVDKTQITQLQAIEKEINKKLDEMSADYDDKKKTIGHIDDDIDGNVRQMKSIELTNYATDAQGNMYRLPLPNRYYDLDRENRKLLQQRADLVKQLNDLRAGAKQVEQQIPTPRFTSVQQLVGIEGTPVLPPTKSLSPASVEPPARLSEPPVIPTAPVTPIAPPATRPALLPPAAPAIAPATRPDTLPPARQEVPDSLRSPGK